MDFFRTLFTPFVAIYRLAVLINPLPRIKKYCFPNRNLLPPNDFRTSNKYPTIRERKKESLNPAFVEKTKIHENFRKLSVYPTREGILSSNPPFLRKNIIDGRYDNVEHYLDLQFRLMKEDFVGPLRQGITEYLQQSQGINGKVKFSNIEIHLDVVFRSLRCENNRVGVVLDFSNGSSDESIFLPDSKRLTYGSLLIFTNDSFGSILCGKVLDRDCEKKQIVVDLEGSYNYLQFKVPHIMVECQVFFEPYYHTLKALQSMSEDGFPMESYLIDVDASVKPPGYLNPTSSVFTIGNQRVDLFGNNWPSADKLQMNWSQYYAFKAALTQKFVLIQGPPGTGKTYLGLQIVKTLLNSHNQKFWYNNSPILIVCATNHALDQFLESLIPITTRIVRVGNQSKNKKLNQFNLKNMPKELANKWQLRDVIKEIQMLDGIYNRKENLSCKDLLTCVRNSYYYNGISLININYLDIKCRLISHLREYEKLYKDYIAEKNSIDAEIMRTKLVIGMTTSAAARLQTTLQDLKSPIVIVEEAAEVLESHVTVSLTKHCKHLILIGDHKQLRPSPADYRLEKEFNLGVSMFERMVLNKIQYNILCVQHRMRPEIAQLIVPHIYPKLENHDSVTRFPPIAGIDSSLFFIHHGRKETKENDSFFNLYESEFLINLSRYLRKVGYKSEDITILSAYKAQIRVLHKESQKYQDLLEGVRISVLDNYQGEECKIILLSLVRNNREGQIGFLKIENRVCIALSRAKHGLYIMGNIKMLSRNSKLWKTIAEVLKKQNCIGNFLPVHCVLHQNVVAELKQPKDFEDFGIRGCVQICGSLLECGHKCSKICHIFLSSHHVSNFCTAQCSQFVGTNLHYTGQVSQNSIVRYQLSPLPMVTASKKIV